MMCPYCLQPMVEVYSWATLFHEQTCCATCATLLTKRQEGGCIRCGKDSVGGSVCDDCVRWERYGVKLCGTSLYRYDEAFANWLYRAKYLGDYRLLQLVQTDVATHFQTVAIDVVVPIPLAPQRMNERKFNQAHTIASYTNKPICAALSRHDDRRQAVKRRSQRLQLYNVYEPLPAIQQITGQRVCLVDDVYTTGATIHFAAKELLRFKPESLCYFILARR